MRARRLIYIEMEKKFAKLGITPEQSSVFDLCAEKGQVTISDITSKMLREPHTILGIINRMEAKGWIRKGKDINKRGLITIALSKKGRDLHQQMIDLNQSAPQPAAVLTQEERLYIKQGLSKIINASLSRLDKMSD